MHHDNEPGEDEQPAGSEDSEHESLNSKEVQELQEQQRKKQPSPPKCKQTPTKKRKEKAPQKEKRLEESKRQGPFGTIMDALQEIQEHFGHSRSIIPLAYAMIDADDEDKLLEVLEELPHKQTIFDLQANGEKLQVEVN